MENSKSSKFFKIDISIFIITCLYLLVPIVILLSFWFKWYISLPAVLAILFATFCLIKRYKSKTEEQYKNIFNLKKLAIVFLIIVIINVMSGAGGIFFQNWDYSGRNAILHDLINNEWPVKYDYSNLEYETASIGSNEGVLSYYFAYFLPGAVVGKLFGFNIASIFMLLWQILGTTLFFYFVFRKFNKVKIRYLLVFFMFGGIDVITKVISNAITGNTVSPIGLEHIDTANNYFCMSTFITQLFWVFNQSIPAWLVTILFVNEQKYENLGVYAALLVPYSPFPVIGIVVWFLIVIIFGFNLNEKITISRIKSLFSLSNIVAVLSVIPIGLLFMQNSSDKGFVLAKKMQEGDLYIALLMYVIYLILEFGIYAIIITKENRKKVISYFAIFAILPLFYLGGGLDLGNRATIPILVLLYLEIINFVDTAINNKWYIRLAILGVILCLSSVTNFNEFYRSIVRTYENKINNYSNYSDGYETFAEFENKECRIFIKNFVAPYNKDNFFYKRILK